jgi:hypothetical protein
MRVCAGLLVIDFPSAYANDADDYYARAWRCVIVGLTTLGSVFA